MRTCMLAVAVALCLGLPWSSALAGSRDEIVMQWDDGEAEGYIARAAGTRVAAGFQAPSSTSRLTGVQIYICDDGVTNPYDPLAPTTEPFELRFFRMAEPGVVEPGDLVGPAYIPFPASWMYPEEYLLDIELPSPRDVGDPSLFPEGWFFVAVKWLHNANPRVGVDLDPPDHSFYWHGAWPTWEPLAGGDVVIRAVVSDSSGSAVIEAGWSAVKWEYR